MPGEITARELWDRLHGTCDHPFYVLDVRNEDDAARWSVEGACDVRRVNVPYFAFLDDPAAALARLPQGLGEAVCVCAKGDSSEFVRGVLAEAGLPAVNVAGGMLAWGDLHVPLRLDDGRQPGLELWQVSRYGKGCLSYAIVCGEDMAVVDPSRFHDVYLRLARSRGARVVEVLETHVHADHLSGAAELARRTGARWRVRSGAGPEPRHPAVAPEPLEDREATLVGDALVEALALRTPGHTPGSTCYVVAGRWLFTGDTLFVGGVGRPDLGGEAAAWAADLRRSLHLLCGLPGRLEVLPAHCGGRADADAGGAVHAPLSRVRERAPELRLDEREFVARLGAADGRPPEAYAEICRANLGLQLAGDRAAEWELGRNECAAARRGEARWSGSSTHAG
jgi:glyoxylase-like metal-dependent hydrolase (beta-lactamase superfamily II)